MPRDRSSHGLRQCETFILLGITANDTLAAGNDTSIVGRAADDTISGSDGINMTLANGDVITVDNHFDIDGDYGIDHQVADLRSGLPYLLVQFGFPEIAEIFLSS